MGHIKDCVTKAIESYYEWMADPGNTTIVPSVLKAEFTAVGYALQYTPEERKSRIQQRSSIIIIPMGSSAFTLFRSPSDQKVRNLS
ncbi:hypothetical protein DAPPUDRAFT_248341 [Daphnia pulex]|uniref:Uncharacterized protein n=1 Tax=Daphnia pulex TaxID=6669 RepID=E9GU76_DAPPU|nr:hypothetical protein DAPPUDRAFT_248341 [Daphnia pulex]|eukprot:EFX76985.1 hypothetical protein DAPPUDRAFT_248341 [Daphnia pulex]